VNLKRRLQSLEKVNRAVRNRKPFRIVVTRVGELSLERSTCSRTRHPDGGVTEIVRLSGRDQDMGEEALENFIAGFPIEKSPQRGHQF
jgi:hypothetical protein